VLQLQACMREPRGWIISFGGILRLGLERWVFWRPIHAVQRLGRKGMVLHALCKRARIIIQKRGSKREREKIGERCCVVAAAG